MLSRDGLCGAIPAGSEEGESEDGELDAALEKAAVVPASDERGDKSFAGADDDAGVSGDGLAAEVKPGIVRAIVGAFLLPGSDEVATSAGVIPIAGARFLSWIVPSEPLPAWFAESPEGKLPTGCVGELVNGSSGIASGTGTRGEASAKTAFDPAEDVFFDELFAPGVLPGVVGFPVCTDGFEGNAVAGAAA